MMEATKRKIPRRRSDFRATHATMALPTPALALFFSAPELYERLGITKSRKREQKGVASSRTQAASRQGGRVRRRCLSKAAAEAYEVLSGAVTAEKVRRPSGREDRGARLAFVAIERSGRAVWIRGDTRSSSSAVGTNTASAMAGGTTNLRSTSRSSAQSACARSTASADCSSPKASGARYGLVGFYRRGEEASLKQGLRFPYPFAGWSLASQGDGFWWRDALQTALVSVGELASNDGKLLLDHFGLTSSSRLPAVAWVNKDADLSFELTDALHTHEQFVSWVYRFLGASIRIVNNDHRDAKVWWLDGTSAKPQGTVKANGGVFERSSFVSHRWYCWAEDTQGSLLTPGASLGDLTLTNVGEVHELKITPKCVDSNGHCVQWRQLGECERNKAYMSARVLSQLRRLRSMGWLYPDRVGQHPREAAMLGGPSVRREQRLPWSAQHNTTIRDVRSLPYNVFNWLASSGLDPPTLRALRAAMAPPPVPPPDLPPPSPPPPASGGRGGESRPPPPPPRDEL